MSVLVVEDDARLREFLEIVVRRCGLTCHAVTSGDAALSAIQSEKYSAVVLDLMLPGISGFDVLRSLRATKPHLLRRIIVLTAVSQSTFDREFDAQALVWHIMRKPFDVGELVASIDACSRYHTTDWPKRRHIATWLAQRSAEGGAQAAVIALISGARELHVHVAHGFPAKLLRSSFPLALSARDPICAAARTGRAVWLASIGGDIGYPLSSIWTGKGSKAIAAVPLLRHGVVSGAIGWSFAEPQSFDDRQRAYFLETATDCAAMMPAIPATYRSADRRP